ncbi:MAG: hypothetical protein NTW78_03870 [Campylobacterales bacterium]|nr:hypothetical protein [Campylobacterales bacterium]
MSLDLTDLKEIYTEFLKSSKDALLEVQAQTQMEDEFLATAVATIISSCMTNSIQAIDVLTGVSIKNAQSEKDLKDSEISLRNAQITESIASTAIKNVQSTKDLLVKDSEISLRNAQITESIASTAIKNVQSTKDLLVKDSEISLRNVQITESTANTAIKNAQNAKDLLVKDGNISLIARQNTALDDAKHVKKAEVLGNTLSMIYSGGLTPPLDMSKAFNDSITSI